MFRDSIAKFGASILLTFLALSFPFIIVASVIRAILRPLWETRKNIAGEVALITGSGNGLGKEIAIKLAAKGCHIAVVDINEEAAKATAEFLSETYNVKTKAFKADVAKYDEVVGLSRNVEEHLGPVTILVNNAAVLLMSTSTNPPADEIQQMINTNLTAHLWTVRVFLEKMKNLGKGHIVAVSSISGFVPLLRQLEYTATKFAVRGMMQALQTEIFAQDCEFIKTTTAFPYFLQSNAKVVEIVQRLQAKFFFPIISTVEAANAIVEGVVTNQSDVFVPLALGLSFKFISFLPNDWLIYVFNHSLGRKAMRRAEW